MLTNLLIIINCSKNSSLYSEYVLYLSKHARHPWSVLFSDAINYTHLKTEHTRVVVISFSYY